LFQAASTTKTFTAAIVLQLVNEGRLRLDDKVGRWFPNLPNAGVMTVEHLLRHLGGLVSFNALPALGEAYRPADEVIRMVAAEAPLFCPGTTWAYSNTGYAILGRIVEKIEARPFPDGLANRLIVPLALRGTVLRRPGVDTLVVRGHASGRPVRVLDGYATAYTAGAMASTASDLVHFWHAALAGDIVAPATVRAMFSRMPAMTRTAQSFYGLGVQVYDVPDGPGLMLGHSGGITGFTSIVAYVGADDIYVSVTLNDQDAPAEAGLWRLIRTVREFRASAARAPPAPQ
jgi:D-alanyl-D-alanine carboxypeptidase